MDALNEAKMPSVRLSSVPELTPVPQCARARSLD